MRPPGDVTRDIKPASPAGRARAVAPRTASLPARGVETDDGRFVPKTIAGSLHRSTGAAVWNARLQGKLLKN